jgi:indole-3-glycerol phosphate synthase
MSDLHKTDILAQIIDSKRKELAGLMTPKRSLKRALAESPSGIIAEFKRKSPSKGWIHADAFPEEVVPAYAKAGAAALSVLTDEEYFGGSLDFIRRVRPLVDIPILRKDFIIDPYQLYQAREAGADAVLLIAACLSREDCAALTAEAHRLGLEVLLEVHSPEELDYITPDVDVVGVNNRHLGSFVTDVQTSFDMAPLLAQRADRNYFSGKFAEKPISAPPSTTPTHATAPIFISESGISDPATVRALREAGFHGFLMGENFMKEPDPGAALATFIQAL